MPGISDARSLDVLAQQIVASRRREDYYRLVQMKPISAARADPNNPSFDAERAVAHHIQQGNIDEACWLIFLMTHFARAADTGWLRLRDVYGMLGQGIWSWDRVTNNPAAFAAWLNANWRRIRGKFGNHRKYASLRPGANLATTDVVASYITWIGPEGHRRRFAQIVRDRGNDPHVLFGAFYNSMDVLSFGRLGKFDYLALIGRYELAPISAGSAYLDGATGPLAGARMLFDDPNASSSSKAALQSYLDALDHELQVGMEVLEDSLCNWQKSPRQFIHYVG